MQERLLVKHWGAKQASAIPTLQDISTILTAYWKIS